jgi:cytochrome c-type biogenesis protein CcsB
VAVDAGLAALSDHLFGAALVAYAPAALGFAVEAAFGVRAVSPQPARVLVGAGGPDVVAADDLDAGARATDTVNAASAPTAAERAGKAAVWLTILGFALHAGSILTRGLAAERIPWGNMCEFISATCLAVVGAYLYLIWREKARVLGAFVLGPVLLSMGLAGTVLYTSAGPVQAVLSTYWLPIHVTAAVVATGVFILGSTSAMLHLMSLHHDVVVAEGKTPGLSGLARRLPPPETLDRLAQRAIGLGFPIWTFAVIAGAIWAESAWGRYWGWDPKETWAFITWVAYAAYLHARSTAGWKGRAASWIAVIALVCLMFNFFGVNLVITGKHSYAGV